MALIMKSKLLLLAVGTLLSALLSLPSLAAQTMEQRIDKLERQMNRLKVMQMDMQNLREDLQENFGAVEEMVHKLDELKKQQNSNYQDLNQRIRSVPVLRSEPRAVIKGGSKNREVESYNSAFELVREKRNKDAINAFKKFVKKFPSGKSVGDAWYWMGRLYSVEGEGEESSKAFAHAKYIFTTVVEKEPGTEAAKHATQRLKKIK